MFAFIVFFPIAASVIVALLKSNKARNVWAILSCAITMGAMVYAALTMLGGKLVLPLCNLSFMLDGFRAVYGVVVCMAWLMAAMLSPDYFRRGQSMGRYYFFFLFCQGATIGVFLSADLYTTFMFFEMMSLSSYVWVVQEETLGAIEGGKSYLTYAVLGGLVTLMGVFILYALTGTLEMSQLQAACAAVTNRGALWASALCIFFGFAVKAGAFPLYTWLPQSYPVTPAPATAMLSSILTKAGLFGVLLVTAQILHGDHAWGVLLLVLAVITMVLGAVKGVFSNNLMHILGCSSMSQIGFILVGIAIFSLLGEDNAMAAHGSILYMLNHSLVKLTLFLFSGVVCYNTGALDLNRIRGFGRNKPVLHVLFLCGACSLAGIPGFCGYLSKTLVHEAIVEYAHISGSWAITMVEWLFLFSGGLTAAYLTKIYIAVFWQKGAPAAKKTPPKWGSPLSMIALALSAITMPIIGLMPYRVADKITDLMLPFIGGEAFPHQVAYFSLTNLKGVAISLTVGALVYIFFIRKKLSYKIGDQVRYLDRWPEWLDLEAAVYKPFFTKLLTLLGFLCRAVCDLLDLLLLLGRRTFLRDSKERINTSPYSLSVRIAARFSHCDEPEMADRMATAQETRHRITNSLSFALMMTCLGMCVILVCMILYVFA